MNIQFKYNVGQTVFYKSKKYTILSRSYVETANNNIIKYNLRSTDKYDINGYEPNVWQEDISTLRVIK